MSNPDATQLPHRDVPVCGKFDRARTLRTLAEVARPASGKPDSIANHGTRYRFARHPTHEKEFWRGQLIRLNDIRKRVCAQDVKGWQFVRALYATLQPAHRLTAGCRRGIHCVCRIRLVRGLTGNDSIRRQSSARGTARRLADGKSRDLRSSSPNYFTFLIPSMTTLATVGIISRSSA